MNSASPISRQSSVRPESSPHPQGSSQSPLVQDGTAPNLQASDPAVLRLTGLNQRDVDRLIWQSLLNDGLCDAETRQLALESLSEIDAADAAERGLGLDNKSATPSVPPRAQVGDDLEVEPNELDMFFRGRRSVSFDLSPSESESESESDDEVCGSPARDAARGDNNAVGNPSPPLSPFDAAYMLEFRQNYEQGESSGRNSADSNASPSPVQD